MANGKADSADFVVRLEGLQLKPDAKERIASHIHAAVMRELAGVDTHGALVFIPRREWLGLWLRTHAAIPQGEQTVNTAFPQGSGPFRGG